MIFQIFFNLFWIYLNEYGELFRAFIINISSIIMYILEATGKIYISIRSLSTALTNKKSVLPLSRVWARFNS